LDKPQSDKPAAPAATSSDNKSDSSKGKTSAAPATITSAASMPTIKIDGEPAADERKKKRKVKPESKAVAAVADADA